MLDVQRVITLPRLEGPAIPGLPSDEHGFLVTDAHGLGRVAPGVYAAGDVTAYEIKQGGIACQQADAAAAHIAAAAGAPVEPEPFTPELRGLLLTEHWARYLKPDSGAVDPRHARPAAGRRRRSPAASSRRYLKTLEPVALTLDTCHRVGGGVRDVRSRSAKANWVRSAACRQRSSAALAQPRAPASRTAPRSAAAPGARTVAAAEHDPAVSLSRPRRDGRAQLVPAPRHGQAPRDPA